MPLRIIKKAILYLLTLFLIGSLNFCLIHLMPGDALVHLLGEEGYAYLSTHDPSALDALKTEYGMDGFLGKAYLRYLVRTVRGEWGWSFYHGRPVIELVWLRLGWTLVLLGPSLVISTVLGGVFGALSGWYSTRKPERILQRVILFVYAVPAYCIGILLLAAAAATGLFPLGGMMPSGAGFFTSLHYLALPMAVLILHATAYKYMIMRNAVCQELPMPYVMTAMSKGLTEKRILFVHILKNVLLPYISVVALHLGFMVGGALLVEVVFSWQGMGTLVYQAVLSRDYPLLSGALMILSISVLAANLAADLLYTVIDPRIRENPL